MGDHSPALVRGTYLNYQRKAGFKFLNMCAQASDFLDIVRQVWHNDIFGYAQFRVMARLNLLKQPLKELNGREFSNIDVSNIDVRENQLRRDLEDVHTRLRLSPQDANIQKEEKEI
ncbi:hypothetical protein RIF29_14326 [Crotalaria pallida]|uniref:Uncharacterized protein n=1 Tax=Crotalaria pallida TaxID=3830 RepID=A0AAN9IBI0_CROPI